MTKGMIVNFRSFKQKVRYHKKAFRSFLTKLSKDIPRNADILTATVEKEVWKEVDCLSCANCCKQMSPTYTPSDITRISNHLDMEPDAFKKKWLYKDREGDWLNRSTPCQFLDLSTNMCNIYSVRPQDCSGFPHLAKKKLKDYIHVHKQNIEFCPATYKLVEKMMEKVNG
ncbi:MAG: YkgJ family cysteine cluster protein [Bacteroidota bacterium]